MLAEQTDAGAGARPVPAATDIYARLDAASPAERAGIVERLLADTAGEGLDLSARDGRRAALRGVVLRDANLQLVNLQGADLREADLTGAMLGQANLEGVLLEGAILQGADLAGATLRDAAMSEVNLREALLEDADLRGAGLRFADLHDAALEGANLRGADLWGAVLEGAVLTGADLRDARLGEGNLRGADLGNADLRGATIQRMDLRGARLRGANLQGVALTGSDLTDAVLSDAELQGVDLSRCTLTHAHVSGVWFDKTRLRRDQLGGAIGEELDGDYEDAAKGYLALERNFIDLGDSDAASWAYGKRRRMRKRAARHAAGVAWRARAWRTAARQAIRAGAAQLVEWVCDYGESIPRVLASILTVYLVYLVLYGLTGSVLHVNTPDNGTARYITHDPRDLAIFSLYAITTSGSPSIGLLPSNTYVQLLTGTEAFLGIFLTGLLGFVTGNKIRR
jgi:uncharacterized protein YjbI with pentapeptide repeats